MQPILQDKETLARQAVEELEQIIKSSAAKLEPKHQESLDKIKYIYGYTGKYPYKSPKAINKYEDILSISILNQIEMEERVLILENLVKSTRARLTAGEFKAEELTLDLKEHTFKYTVFNDFFKDPKAHYGISDLEEIIKDLTENRKIFDFHTDPKLGLIPTGESEDENFEWQYNSDSCMHGYWQKHEDPFSWRKSMIINAAALNNKEIFSTVYKIAKDPDWYRREHEDKEVLNRGIQDAFKPSSVSISSFGSPFVKDIELKESESKRRVDSASLTLLSILETLEAGIKSEEWGFDYGADFNEQNREIVFKAVFNLITFLMSINWNSRHNLYDANAPSTGIWEEIVYWSGTTLDTALTSLALQKFCDMVFSENFSETTAVTDMRKAMNEYSKDLPFYANCLNESYVKMLIQACNSKIYERVVKPIVNEHIQAIHTEENKMDSSLAVLAATDFKFSEDISLDAEIRLNIINSCYLSLSEPQGMRRYNKFSRVDNITGNNLKLYDSYQNLNYHIASKLTPLAQIIQGQKPEVTQFHPKYFSTTECSKRQKLAKPEYSPLFLIGITASIQALAKAKLNLAKHIKNIKFVSPEIEAKLKEIDILLSHFINQSLALIVGGKDINLVKANGESFPFKYNLMESFQAVSDLTGKVKWLPGFNGKYWNNAQLYNGLQIALEAEKELSTIRDLH